MMTEAEKNETKIAVEKILNVLGKKMAIKYYDYDGNYTVDDVVEYDDGYIEVFVKTDKPIPDIMDVKIEPEFIYGKYATASDLIGNLQYQLRYIGNNINLMIDETDSIYKKYGDKIKQNDFKKHPERFIHLCNGSVVEKSSGYTYPLLSNGTIEVDEPFHLASIDNEEWWESLCDDDKKELNKTYS